MTDGPDVEPVEDVVADLLELLAIDTQNPPGDTGAAVEYLADELAAAGVETERIDDARGRPNLVGWIEGRDAETVVYNGHLDTVPFDATAWTHDPLGERDGDVIYGRGAADMKGAVAAMLATARAYAAEPDPPPRTLAFAFVSDEEVLAGGGLETVLSRCDVARARTVIGEMTGTPERPSVTVADKGGVWLTLEATGEAAHGSRPMLGTNAIDRLYAAVEAIRSGVAAHRFDLDPAVERIVDRSVPFYAEHMPAEEARRLFERPTVNLGTLEGGEAINSVPASATAEVDVRVTAGVDPESVLSAVESILADHAGVSIADVEVTRGTFEPVDSPLVDAVASASEAATGEPTIRRSATGGGDAKTVREAGPSAVEFALATETAHGVDERTTVDALGRTADVYAALPYALAERC